MATISTFEMLFKRLTPLPPGTPGTVAPIARRVLQGYFLTITNLENADYFYRVTFNISFPDSNDPNKKLFNNHVFITDVAGSNTFVTLAGNANSTRYARNVTVPARKTALVTLLPAIPAGGATIDDFFATPNPQLEVRGYVELTLPRTGFSFPNNISGTPQSLTPVNVLVTAETRATFLPDNFPSANPRDFDQVNSPLPLAEGRAQIQIPSDPPFFLTLPTESDSESDLDLVQPIDPDIITELEATDVKTRTQMLLTLLGQAGQTPAGRESITQLLNAAPGQLVENGNGQG
jgi:hypothetical protein